MADTQRALILVFTRTFLSVVVAGLSFALFLGTLSGGAPPRELALLALLGLAALLGAGRASPLSETLSRAKARLRVLFEASESSDANVVLYELARALGGHFVGSGSLEATFRARRANVSIARDALLGRCYEIRLETSLGAPRRGRVIAAEPRSFQVLDQDDGLARSLAANPEQWHALFRIYHVGSVVFEDTRVVVRASWGGGVLSGEDEAGRLVRLLERLAVVSEGQGPVEVRVRASAAERCPYCHDGFAGETRDIQECVRCGARHHVECWNELGRCSVFGCGPRVPAASRQHSL